MLLKKASKMGENYEQGVRVESLAIVDSLEDGKVTFATEARA